MIQNAEYLLSAVPDAHHFEQVIPRNHMLGIETPTLGNVRSEKAVADLPLDVRNFAFLITLSAGAVPLAALLI